MEEDGSGGNSSGVSGSGDDVPYGGGVMYVAALNQDAPEYAAAVETGSTDVLYSVVSINGRDGGGGGGGGGGGENHYDMSAPGEKNRGKKATQNQQQPPQQQQQQAPTMVYDVAQHAGDGDGGGAAAAQSADYSHLAPRNDGGESNNFYDLGPQQLNGRQHRAGGGAIEQVEYEEADSSV